MGTNAFFRFAVGLTLAMHFFGLLGMIWGTSRAYFLALTPLNLLLGGLFLYLFQTKDNTRKKINSAFPIFFITAALLGYFVEVAGVQTGKIFGVYTYGETLGWKVWDTPLLIGLNWAVLVVACGTLVDKLSVPYWIKVTLNALALVLLDVLIEPAAIDLGWWTWENPDVPLQNYLAWYAVAFVLSGLYFRFSFAKDNRFAPFLLLAQVFFFLSYNLYLAF